MHLLAGLPFRDAAVLIESIANLKRLTKSFAACFLVNEQVQQLSVIGSGAKELMHGSLVSDD